MKNTKSLVILLFLLFPLIGKAQSTNYAIDPDLYTFYPMEGMAESLGKEKSAIAFGYNSEEDTLVVAIMDDKKTVVIGYLTNDYFFNATKMYDPYWRNDTIFVSSELPYRATQYSFEFVWDSKKESFFATEPHYFDPSENALNKADSLLAAGNLRAAIGNYYMVMYPHAYMNEGEVGIRLMECAHKKAMAFYNISQFDSAALYMSIAFDYYPNSNYISFKDQDDFNSIVFDSSGWQQSWTMDQVKLWLGDHGLFLYKAKKYSESIEFNSYLNTIMPEVAGPYLQLADSYYDSGKKTEAKTAYKKYAELKKAQGASKEIPKRVKERSK